MRLEIRGVHVSDITFGDKTMLAGHVLKLDVEEIRGLVLQDSRLASVAVELAKPGESVRTIHVCDAIQPLVKVEGRGNCYPAASASVETVGTGITHKLNGVSVVLSVEYPQIEKNVVGGPPPIYEAILDMSGPGAQSSLAKTLNVVLAMKLAPGHTIADYHDAVKKAGHRVSEHLAKTTVGQTTDTTSHFQLGNAPSGLPRIIYVHQVLSQLNLAVPFVTWYGNYIADWMPIWVHPNEILDGALVPSALGGYSVKPTSWEFVNNPVIERLYSAHGVEIDFAGVVLQRTRFETFREKQLSANQTANLASLINANAAMITWISAGNAFVEGMLTLQALEHRGIKTVFMTYEHGGKEGREVPLMYSVPEANALVSVGSLDRPITLPPVQRVIGGSDLAISPEAEERISAFGEIKLDWNLPVASAVDHWGFGNYQCVDY
jgi:glycine reductase